MKFYSREEKKVAPATVMIPAMQMERELIAPSTGPISMARAVPMPWEDVPMARPFAIGLVIRSALSTYSPAMFPIIPVKMMEATVMGT